MNLQPTPEEFTEKLLGSWGRVRIFITLAEEGELNISQLSRQVGMNHTNVNNQIENLKELGLVKEKWYSKIRMLEADFDEINIKFKKCLGAEFRVR